MGPAHPDCAVLQRLSQGVQGMGGKLGQLVQKQHTTVGQADLARTHLAAAPTDQRHDGGGVMGRPKRGHDDQFTFGTAAQRTGGCPVAGGRGPTEQQPGRRVHPDHLGATVGVEVGQSPMLRWASIVLPDPGGPSISRWWPPPAATSIASLATR